MVCLNTYVPTLAKRLADASTDSASHAELDLTEAEAKTASAISSKGISIGYAAGVALLVLLLIPVTLLKGSLWSLRVSLLVTGVWWLLASVCE